MPIPCARESGARGDATFLVLRPAALDSARPQITVENQRLSAAGSAVPSTSDVGSQTQNGVASVIAAAAVVAIGWQIVSSSTSDADDGVAAYWYVQRPHHPTELATSVDILVLEVECSSGRGAAGNMLPPTVSVTADQVSIAVETRPRSGSEDCQANPLAPLTVQLPEPLGHRTLVDANGGAEAEEYAEDLPHLLVPPLRPLGVPTGTARDAIR
jgi:hypothetical protein